MASLGASFAQVAIPVPVHRRFTYGVPPGMAVEVGMRVHVPFGRRRMVGLVVGLSDIVPDGIKVAAVKPLLAVLDDAPIVDAQGLALAQWVEGYYLVAPGEAHALLLPPRMVGARDPADVAHRYKVIDLVGLKPEGGAGAEGASAETGDPAETGSPVETGDGVERRVKARRGARMQAVLDYLRSAQGDGPVEWPRLREVLGIDKGVLRRLQRRGDVVVTTRKVLRDPFAGLQVERDSPPPLTPDQTAAVAILGEAVVGGKYRGFLFKGVTGSGKTEVYLRIIGEALKMGRSALVLVPEIALTPQLVSRFVARLGDGIAVLHSGLESAARREQWLRIQSGELRVVIGARSAVFAPIKDLGVIVVDEEHEPSFKQDSSPRYHGRDLALVRGYQAGVPVVLGTATPSMETWQNVADGKLTLVRLDHRVHGGPLPAVRVVDLRDAEMAGEGGIFSRIFMDALTETIEAGDQAILFLNRRGFSSFLMCTTCGTKADCDGCSVTYTWHERRGRLVCHYCDESRRRPRACPSCFAETLVEVGFGTEQVEERLKALLPSARVARMDRDTTRGKDLQTLLTAFRAREYDVLVGTQMVAKGHDFPRVTLAGVLLAEQGLAFPDFRAAERTFQLLTQIAGRAGRGEREGRVVIQTHQPDHYAIRHAVAQDADGFCAEELVLRRARDFPPYTRLALWRLTARDGHGALMSARRLASLMVEVADRERLPVKVYAPQAAPIERIKQRFRFQILVGATHRNALRRVLRRAQEEVKDGRMPGGVQVALDIDPLNFL